MRLWTWSAIAFGLLLTGCGSQSDLTGALNQGSVSSQQQTAVVSPGTLTDRQDPAVALAALKAGNARYVNGTNQSLNRSEQRPLELNSTQAPIVGVLCCSDSRVAPELAFDQSWGDVFVARIAGNVAEPGLVGSLEYAVGALGTRLLMVMGHEQCGAVKAALGSALPPGNLGALVKLIVPAAESVQGQPGDPLETRRSRIFCSRSAICER